LFCFSAGGSVLPGRCSGIDFPLSIGARPSCWRIFLALGLAGSVLSRNRGAAALGFSRSAPPGASVFQISLSRNQGAARRVPLRRSRLLRFARRLSRFSPLASAAFFVFPIRRARARSCRQGVFLTFPGARRLVPGSLIPRARSPCRHRVLLHALGFGAAGEVLGLSADSSH
jgi:hypothetical protein